MKKNKIALYDPYLDVLGGGERHILSILKVLEESRYDLDIFWPTDLTKEFNERLHISFIKPPNFISGWNEMSIFTRFQELGEYDMFFYVTNGSYFFSSAKKNVIFCMVPQKSLYLMSPLNKLKMLNSVCIANSRYTSDWLSKWGIKAQVIYPYIDDSFINTEHAPKEKIILSVGRFFNHLHAKRQDVAISWFKELKKSHPSFEHHKLVLAGSLKEEDTPYFEELQRLAENRTDIEFKTNISFDQMFDLYKKAQIYWHFAGFEVDINHHPEAVEHLGITPLEAMSMGCITYAYNAGGPKEIITNGKNGFLFSSQTELFECMTSTLTDENSIVNIQTNARTFVKTTFSYEVFKKRVLEIFT